MRVLINSTQPYLQNKTDPGQKYFELKKLQTVEHATGVNDHIYIWAYIYIFENFKNFEKSMTIYIYFRSVSL